MRFMHIGVFAAVFAISACSTKEEAPAQVKYIAVDSYFESVDGQKDHSLPISGEYANFSRECSKGWNEMGSINYAREVISYGVVPTKIPNQIVKNKCTLSLVGINLSSNGISGGVATAPNRLSGFEKQACYQLERGEKTCLSNKAPKLTNHPFLGTMTSTWKEIQ